MMEGNTPVLHTYFRRIHVERMPNHSVTESADLSNCFVASNQDANKLAKVFQLLLVVVSVLVSSAIFKRFGISPLPKPYQH